jgi:hypothetical protein
MASDEFPQSHFASGQLGNETYHLALGMPIKGADWTLHRVAMLEGRLATYSLEPEVTDVDQRQQIMQELNAGLSLYHEALPFSEAERRWMSGICAAVDTELGRRMSDRTEPSIDALRSSEATIVSGGLFKVVNGDELYQHWRSWCSSSGEFEGSGGVGIAYRGLQRITSLLKPGVF